LIFTKSHEMFKPGIPTWLKTLRLPPRCKVTTQWFKISSRKTSTTLASSTWQLVILMPCASSNAQRSLSYHQKSVKDGKWMRRCGRRIMVPWRVLLATRTPYSLLHHRTMKTRKRELSRVLMMAMQMKMTHLF
uniref:Secreted protein n=1 Tax=Rodentolepis nana TaxID=102285 RepID=A0A0R3TJ69_RODNA